MNKAERSPIGYSRISKEQELITYDDIRGILDAELEIKEHPLPNFMVGNLWTIDGKVQVCEAIMERLEYRSKLFKGHTKPQEDKDDEDKRGSKREG